MLDFLRRSATSVFSWLLLGVLALIFGLSFGLPSDSLTLGNQPIAVVYGDQVTDDEYQYQFNLMERVLPLPKDANFQRLMGLREEVLDAVVERLVVSKAAEDMGLAATAWDAETLTLNGQLIVLGDTFDWLGPANFNYDFFTSAHLRSLQVPEKRYLEYQRREILARTARDLLASAVTVSERALRAEYDKQANTVSLRYVRFDDVEYSQLVDVEAAEIDAYVGPNREQLKKQLESQGSRFTKLPKQVRLELIEVKKTGEGADPAEGRRKIAAARKRIVGGESFRAVAREVSEHAGTARRGGDYGWVSVEGTGTGLDVVVDEAAKSIADGEVSEILEGEDSLFVVRVTGRREGDVPEEDALRELAAEALALERGKVLARQAAEEALAAVKDGKKLETLFEAPAALGEDAGGIDALGPGREVQPVSTDGKPKIRVTGPFTKGAEIPGLGASPELSNAAWAADPQQDVIPKVFEVRTGAVIAGIERRETATDEGFAEARRALYDRMVQRKAGMVTARWAHRQCLEARGRGDIVGTQAKIARLMTYDTKEGEEAPSELRPYALCDRVGNRGGLLRTGLTARAGGGDAR